MNNKNKNQKLKNIERSKYNVMRSLLFFDLPVGEDYQIANYRKFKSNLIKLGYTMIQGSVYVKVLNSKTIANQHIEKLNKIVPKEGNVRVMVVTEKQYEDMFILTGNKTHNEIVNNTNRFVEV